MKRPSTEGKSAISSPRGATILAAVLSASALCPLVHAESITIDFGRQTAESSHLIFGGCKPRVRDEKAWARLAEAGMTMVRYPVFLHRRLRPTTTTLADYRAAMGKPGSIADLNSEHWDWSEIDAFIALCRRHHVASLLELTYSFPWLGYNGDFHSPPRDWEVWEDVVAQLVRRYAGKVDYWELWNEPNGTKFMPLEGSPYEHDKDGRLRAYIDICRHTMAAIKSTGLSIRIGGPSPQQSNSAPFIDRFLAHADVASQLDFLTQHIYFHAPIPQRCFPPTIYELERKHGVGPLPLFITEWNCHSWVEGKEPHPLNNSPASVGWVGKTFVLFLQWGVRGSTFYAFYPGRQIDDGWCGAYKMIDGEPQLFRFLKVYHLLSKVLGLGQPGDIKVFDTHVAGLPDELSLPPLFVDSLYAVGCSNAASTPVVIVANPSASPRPASLSLSHLSDGTYRVVAFVVRPDHTPAEATQATSLFERTLSTTRGALGLEFPVAAHHVIGLRLEHLRISKSQVP